MDFIDIIVRLITPLEGVDYAIAPIVLAALSAAPGIIGGISAANQASKQATKALNRANQDKDDAQAAIERLKSGVLEFEPEKFKFSEKNLEAYDLAQSAAPEMQAQRALEQSLATSATAASTDPRLAAMTAASTAGQAAQAAETSAIGSLGRRQKAAGDLATVQDETEQMNVEARQQQFDKELGIAQSREQQAINAAREARDAKSQAKVDKNQALIQGGLSLVTGGLGMQGDNPTFGGLFQGDALATNPFVPQSGATAETADQIKARLGLQFVEGGKLSHREGGQVYETEGEFDHSTNKKALVDEETGVKEAELTGGELVFNPDHTKKIEQFIAEGRAKALFNFLQDLLSQPRFQP